MLVLQQCFKTFENGYDSKKELKMQIGRDNLLTNQSLYFFFSYIDSDSDLLFLKELAFSGPLKMAKQYFSLIYCFRSNALEYKSDLALRLRKQY